jgi:hypothetical protein
MLRNDGRAELWAVLPDNQKKQTSERLALYKDKRIMEQ